MTAKAWESDSQDQGRKSGAGELNDLKDGYRETSRMNLFLAKEAVFSDEEAFRLLLKRNDG
ncbi:MAG: hypothetical protein LBL26_05125 [Peptococcaceae bacterium]|jgi:hypothetical protein|nr:hypothetical protein [Peptococcaceae bacterium]